MLLPCFIEIYDFLIGGLKENWHGNTVFSWVKPAPIGCESPKIYTVRDVSPFKACLYFSPLKCGSINEIILVRLSFITTL